MRLQRSLTALAAVALFLPASACGGHAPGSGLSHTVSRFVARIPTAGSNGYDEPARSTREDLAEAFRDVVRGNRAAATDLAQRHGFDVTSLRDTDGRVLDILAEHDPGDHGWGLYVHARGAGRRVVVEVPHPIADRYTELEGVDVFRRVRGAALLLAGADRHAGVGGAADVAHRSDTVFAAIDEVAAPRGFTIVQLHGFDSARHAGYGDVVVATGDLTQTARSRAVANAIRRAGFRVCVASRTTCRGLAATMNVEGRAARSRGASFLHIEASHAVRASPQRRRRLATALAAALS